MVDLVIRPTVGAGNKIIIQDQAGQPVLTTADSGGTLNNITGILSEITPGTSGNLLTSDGTNWASAAAPLSVDTLSFRNRLINGDMQVAQRGPLFDSSDGSNVSVDYTFENDDDMYTLDMWYILSDGDNVIDVTQSSEAPTNQKYSLGMDVETAHKKFGIAQIIENADSRCVGLIGNTVTFSFKAKVSATTKLDNVKAAIISWSGTADSVTSDVISAWGAEDTNPTLIANATFENTPANLNLTTSWATYSVSGAIDTASTSNIIVLIWSDVTDTTTGDFIYVTDCQLEAGASATSYERKSYADVLQSCCRYFQAIVGRGWITGGASNRNKEPICTLSFRSNGWIADGYVRYLQTMRVPPSIKQHLGGNTMLQMNHSAGYDEFEDLKMNWAGGVDGCWIYCNVWITGTSGHSGPVVSNDSSAFVGFTAEL